MTEHTRRKFLGAAAAALALVPSIGSAETTSNDSKECTVDNDPVCGDVRVGGEIFSSFVTERYADKTTYTVASYPEDPNAQVSLEMWNDYGTFGLNLTAAQAEQLAGLLITAAGEEADE